MQTLLNAIMSGPGVTNRPMINASKTANTITVRGSAALVAIAEQVIENNDKPRAEIVIDVEILEVNRQRAKQYGLQPLAVRDRRRLLAGGRALDDHERRQQAGPGRHHDHDGAVQPEHDHARESTPPTSTSPCRASSSASWSPTRRRS